ncbi:hypothetical protein VN1244_05850 [Helicobacter pylori]|nr:hypothetical protein VN1244_05850 [Helicobacter pylori]
MKLYNKIQELINESESFKQNNNNNNEALGLAKNELSELDNLLRGSELQSELQNAKSEIVSETTNNTINALTNKILGILETRLNAIMESVIKNLDFSFLVHF